MKNLYKIIAVIGMVVLLESCYYDTYLDVDIPVPEEVSYSETIQPLWETDCVSCHGPSAPNLEAGGSYDNLVPAYVTPGDPDNSILYQSLIWADGVANMPTQQQWDDNKINLVKAWIEQGAKNN